MKKAKVLVCMALAASMLAGCGLSGQQAASATSEAAQSDAAATDAAASDASTESSDSTSAEDVSAYQTEAVIDGADADPAITLVMAEVNPVDTTISGRFDSFFAQEVERLSGGSITVDLRGNGVLGNESDVLDGMVGKTGTVEICRTSINTMNQYGVGSAVLTTLPFTFTSRDHYWKFVESDLGQEILQEAQNNNTGLRAICYGEEGFRNFFTTADHPVNTVDDMKGLKIRTSTDPIMVGMIQALGSTSSPVAYNELYTSLQNGTIDGAENPVNNYYSNSFQEVAPNLTLDEHTLGATWLEIGRAHV